MILLRSLSKRTLPTLCRKRFRYACDMSSNAFVSRTFSWRNSETHAEENELARWQTGAVIMGVNILLRPSVIMRQHLIREHFTAVVAIKGHNFGSGHSNMNVSGKGKFDYVFTFPCYDLQIGFPILFLCRTRSYMFMGYHIHSLYISLYFPYTFPCILLCHVPARSWYLQTVLLFYYLASMHSCNVMFFSYMSWNALETRSALSARGGANDPLVFH